MKARPVLLNTDIGNDPDDLLALCFLLMRPDIDLVGISTCGPDVHVRARLVRKVCALAGRDVPVAAGAAYLLAKGGNPAWEPSGISKSHTTFFKVKYSSEPENLDEMFAMYENLLSQHRGDIALLSIGPHTNIAKFILRNGASALSGFGEIILMSGIFRQRLGMPDRDGNQVLMPRKKRTFKEFEYNLSWDFLASKILIEKAVRDNIQIRMVGHNVTKRFPLRQKNNEALLAWGLPEPARSALMYMRQEYFSREGLDQKSMHDPLASACLVDPGIMHWVPVTVEIDERGRDIQTPVEKSSILSAVEFRYPMQKADAYNLIFDTWRGVLNPS